MLAQSQRAALSALLLVAGSAGARDARIDLLGKQLTSPGDSRVRTQAAALLSRIDTEPSAALLCSVLGDRDDVVRMAAVNGLANMKHASVERCAETSRARAPQDVLAVLDYILARKSLAPHAVYVALSPGATGPLAPEELKLLLGMLQDQLLALGARIAPAGESKRAAEEKVQRMKLRAYLLQVNASPHGTGLKLELLAMSYPGQSLQGSFSVKAQGAGRAALLKAMVPRLVKDAAEELDWSTPARTE